MARGYGLGDAIGDAIALLPWPWRFPAVLIVTAALMHTVMPVVRKLSPALAAALPWPLTWL